MNPKQGFRAKNLEDSGPFPMPGMSSAALKAEKLAESFGLGWMAPKQYETLADIIEHVKEGCTCQADRDKLGANVVPNKAQRVG